MRRSYYPSNAGYENNKVNQWPCEKPKRTDTDAAVGRGINESRFPSTRQRRRTFAIVLLCTKRNTVIFSFFFNTRLNVRNTRIDIGGFFFFMRTTCTVARQLQPVSYSFTGSVLHEKPNTVTVVAVRTRNRQLFWNREKQNRVHTPSPTDVVETKNYSAVSLSDVHGRTGNASAANGNFFRVTPWAYGIHPQQRLQAVRVIL